MALVPLTIFVRSHIPLAKSVKMLSSQKKLIEMCGKLEQTLSDSPYETGQFFLHSKLDYRGVVLFSWSAALFDLDAERDKAGYSPISLVRKTKSPYSDLESSTQWYYQALVDERDIKYLRPQMQSLAVFRSKSQSSPPHTELLDSVDYVTHDEIYPYANMERDGLRNPMFHQFLTPDPLRDKDDVLFNFIPKDVLRVWQEDNTSWLKLNSVFQETTQGVRVTVVPFFHKHGLTKDETSPSVKYFWEWRYTIRIESLREAPCKLRRREWKIKSDKKVEMVRGAGVVGLEPEFSKENKVFQYSSYVRLSTPVGLMWGHYEMEAAESGETFKVQIPPFVLESVHKGSDTS